MSLGDASVAIKADFSGFEAAVRSGLEDALSRVASVAAGVSGDIDKAFAEAASSANDQLATIGTDVAPIVPTVDAEPAVADLDAAFATAAGDADSSLATIGDGLTVDAESPAGDIEAAFAGAAVAADDSLAVIGNGISVTGDVETASGEVTTGFENAKEEANKELEGINLKETIMHLGEALAIVEGAKWFAEGAKTAEETNSALAVTQQLITSTGGAAGQTAQGIAEGSLKMAEATGISKDSVIAASNSLLVFKNISGDSFNRALSGAADLSTVMGGDLQGATKLLGKALDDPEKGFSRLTRAGITFTDAQKAQIKAMQDSGNIAGAQGIILDALAGKVGGAAEAGATASSKIKVSFTELQETAGAGLSDALAKIGPGLQTTIAALGPVLGQIGGALGDALTALGPAIDTLLSGLGPLFDAFGQLTPIIAPIAELFAGALSDGISLVAQLLKPLLAAVAPVITALTNALKPILPVIAAAFTQILNSLTPLLPVIGTSLTKIINALAPALPPLLSAFLQMNTVFLQLLPAITPLIPPLTSLITFLLSDAIVPALTAIAGAITFLTGIFTDAITAVIGFVTGIVSNLGALPGQLLDIIKSIGDGILNGLQAAWDAAKAALGAFIDAFLLFYVELPGKLLGLVVSAGETVISALQTAWDTAKNAVTGFIGDVVSFVAGLPGKAAEALATLSSEVGAKIAEMATTGYLKVTGFITDAVSFIAGLPGKAASALADLASSIGGKIADAATSVANGVTGFITDAVTSIGELPGKAVTALGTLASSIGGVFSGLWTTVKSDVEGFIGNIVDFVGGLPGKIVDTLSGMGSTIIKSLTSVLKSAYNSVVDLIPDVTIPVPFFDDIHLSARGYLHWNADGGIYDRPTILQGVGEAGKEAVIPLTNPSRALALADESGLTSLILAARTRGGVRSGQTGGTTQVVAFNGPTTFYDPTDVNTVTGVIHQAYEMARS